MTSLVENRTILVVDDEKINRQQMISVFSEEYIILEAENGFIALEILNSMKVDAVLLDLDMPGMNGLQFLDVVSDDKELEKIPIIVVADSINEDDLIKVMAKGVIDVIMKPLNDQLMRLRIRNILSRIELLKRAERADETEKELRRSEMDPVSGLFNRNAFIRHTELLLSKAQPNQYILVRWDIDNFKLYNEVFSSSSGDEYLRQIGDYWSSKDLEIKPVIACRFDADHFIFLVEEKSFDITKMCESLIDCLENVKTSAFEFVPRMGLYLIDDPTLDITLMCDCALLALKSTKNRYGVEYKWFVPSLWVTLKQEHKIVAEMEEALLNDEFKAYFQPQYNISNGKLIGAEVLVRWVKENGQMLLPNSFIPLFEKNGFVFELDRSIWEKACIFQRKQLDLGKEVIPVSVNVSRYDLVREEFLDTIIALPKKYDVPFNLINLEITESAFSSSVSHIVEIVDKLREVGFLVEVDDFGSGYSSFSTLKDVSAGVIKIDMHFFSDKKMTQRGGTIIESIVRMAKWLGMLVIAEGVETKMHVSFLQSIGCNYVQGFFFGKPMTVEEYELLLSQENHDSILTSMETIEGMDRGQFWNPSSIETLLFSSYVGGACVLEYHDNKLEILRMNKSFKEVLNTNHAWDALMGYDVFDAVDPSYREELTEIVNSCINLGDSRKGVCHIFFNHETPTHNEYIRYKARVIAKTDTYALCYVLVDNVSSQVRAEQQNRMLIELSGRMLSEADPETALTSVMTEIMNYCEGKIVHTYVFDKTRKHLNCEYEICAPNVPPLIDQLQDLPIDYVEYWIPKLRDMEVLTITTSELDESREAEKLRYERFGIESLIVMPLHKKDDIFGIMTVESPKQLNKNNKNLEALGDYVSFLLARRDLERKVKFENSQLMSLIEKTPIGFTRVPVNRERRFDPANVIINDSFCSMIKMTRQEILDYYIKEPYLRVHPDDIPNVALLIKKAIQTRQTCPIKMRFFAGDDNYLTTQTYYHISEDDKGNLMLNGYFIEISDKEAKEDKEENGIYD